MLEGRTQEARAQREVVDIWWAEHLQIPHLTPRWVLQQIGTNVLRAHFHDDIWIAALERKMSQYDKIVITDCRFAMIRKAGGKIFQVQRGPMPAWVTPYITSGIPPHGVHASEYVWTTETFDTIIKNNGTLEDLKTCLMGHMDHM